MCQNLINLLLLKISRLITIIIPFFNNENTLQRAIDGVIKQNLSELEIILVNNNSTDPSLEIAHKNAIQYSDFVSVVHEFKQSPSAARNKGLQLANGYWIQFLDADDELLPEYFSSQFKNLSRVIDADIIISNHLRRYEWKNKIEEYSMDNDLLKGILTSNGPVLAATIFKTEWLKKFGGFDTAWSASEDYKLFFDSWTRGAKWLINNERKSIIHIRKNSFSRPSDAYQYESILVQKLKLRCIMEDELKENKKINQFYMNAIQNYKNYEITLAASLGILTKQTIKQIKEKYHCKIEPIRLNIFKIKRRLKNILYK